MNSTFQPTTEVYFNQYVEPRWIAGEIMLLIISTVTIYIFAALLYYSWRFRNMAKVSGNSAEMRERYLHYSCAAVILMAIARCVLHQITVFIPRNKELYLCRVMMTTSRIVYNLAICLTFVHLWLRQRMFYTKDELKHLRTKVIEIVDWLVLVLIIGASAVLALVAFIPLNGTAPAQSNHPYLCNVFDYSYKTSVHLYAGLALTFQFALVMLYLYPIIIEQIHRRKEKNNPAQSPSSAALAVYPSLWSGIRRGFTMTVIVIVTDAVAAIVVWLLNREYPGLFSSIIALNDVNLIINVICCICTFRNWRKIVFGFPICRRLGWENTDILRLKRPAFQGHAVSPKIQEESEMSRENNNHPQEFSEEKEILRIENA